MPPVPRPALARPRAGSPQPGAAQTATAVRSSCLLGPRRGFNQLRRLLAGRDAVMSLWRGKRLVGFRATSDGFSRAVLWDIVVAGDLQAMASAAG